MRRFFCSLKKNIFAKNEPFAYKLSILHMQAKEKVITWLRRANAKTHSSRTRWYCKCCGYEADADYVGSLNIKSRADDEEILGVCERYKYNHSELQKNLKIVYKSRNEKYKAAASVSK